ERADPGEAAQGALALVRQSHPVRGAALLREAFGDAHEDAGLAAPGGPGDQVKWHDAPPFAVTLPLCRLGVAATCSRVRYRRDRLFLAGRVSVRRERGS